MDFAYFYAYFYDTLRLLWVVAPAALTWVIWWFLQRKDKETLKIINAYNADRLLESVYTETGRFIAVFKTWPTERQNAFMSLALERERQIVVHGYTRKHDMEHDNEEFAAAAAAYALPPVLREAFKSPVPAMWPWNPESYKPADKDSRHRDWQRAAALLLAGLEKEYLFKAFPVPDIGNVRWEMDAKDKERRQQVKDAIHAARIEQEPLESWVAPPPPGDFFSEVDPPYLHKVEENGQTIEVWVDNKGVPEHHAVVTKDGESKHYLNGVPKP